MGKDKLRKFAENLTFACLVQPEFEDIFHKDHPLKGRWHEDFFHNDNPIVLELGCGKGEYTIALAERNPSCNYIGIDIKGARMWLEKWLLCEYNKSDEKRMNSVNHNKGDRFP